MWSTAIELHQSIGSGLLTLSYLYLELRLLPGLAPCCSIALGCLFVSCGGRGTYKVLPSVNGNLASDLLQHGQPTAAAVSRVSMYHSKPGRLTVSPQISAAVLRVPCDLVSLHKHLSFMLPGCMVLFCAILPLHGASSYPTTELLDALCLPDVRPDTVPCTGRLSRMLGLQTGCPRPQLYPQPNASHPRSMP